MTQNALFLTRVSQLFAGVVELTHLGIPIINVEPMSLHRPTINVQDCPALRELIAQDKAVYAKFAPKERMGLFPLKDCRVMWVEQHQVGGAR